MVEGFELRLSQQVCIDVGMNIEIRDSRMFDTLTETAFGPQCVSDDEAFELVKHIKRTLNKDPRQATPAERMIALSEMRSGVAPIIPTHPSLLCGCGSGLMISYKIYIGETVDVYCAACMTSRPNYLT